MKSDGVGVLVHRSGEPCPTAVPFLWETGAPLREFSLSWADSDTGRLPCPGCQGAFPLWTRVEEGGLSVLTHDGNAICPGDPVFGALTGPESASAPSVVAA
ncbi:hypothetical protein [Streptomyces sp. NPDC091268]|uniref:hypothetical protein n=1 Tax=Streptomyces sp. NPDC091268 TaxID=3365979 RepID=UPI00382B4BD1